MKPRIMASSPEISMTPIRMMSSRVMGINPDAPHLQDAAGRIGEWNRTNLRTSRLVRKPGRRIAPTY
jgi:hypothetical protein